MLKNEITRRMRDACCLGLLGLVLLAGCGKAADKNTADAAADEASAASEPSGAGDAPSEGDVRLSIVDYQGIMERIADERGKVVVMDAWSTSCPPCMKEFHNLVELHEQYGPEQVACISLSFDYEGLGTPEEQAPRMRKFLTSQHATFENLMSSEESDTLYRKFGLAAVPAVFVYNRDGKLAKRFDNQQAKSCRRVVHVRAGEGTRRPTGCGRCAGRATPRSARRRSNTGRCESVFGRVEGRRDTVTTAGRRGSIPRVRWPATEWLTPA